MNEKPLYVWGGFIIIIIVIIIFSGSLHKIRETDRTAKIKNGVTAVFYVNSAIHTCSHNGDARVYTFNLLASNFVVAAMTKLDAN